MRRWSRRWSCPVCIRFLQLAVLLTSRGNSYISCIRPGGLAIVVGFEMTSPPSSSPTTTSATVGTVLRLATRTYNADSSRPSSRTYTTRKDETSVLNVDVDGCRGDYNHYRTIALKSTGDRAVSILTSDVMTSLRASYPQYGKYVQDGDLGENILIDGVRFDYFQLGKQYCIDSTSCQSVQEATNNIMDGQSQLENAVVILEITEPMDPCGNLCKLPYINDDSLTPKQRIERCQDFLQYLGRFDGYRGWYAKVICDGSIHKGATVRCLLEPIVV